MTIPNHEELLRRLEPFGYTHLANGWLYGVWYTGTSFQKAKLYGQYPVGFVKRVSAMFEGLRILHLCCGVCHIEGAKNVDNVSRERTDKPGTQAADLIADVNEPWTWAEDASFDVVLIDPPYTSEEAVDHYGQTRAVAMARVMAEAHRVLVPGGLFACLDEKFPRGTRLGFDLFAVIAMVLGEERRVRLFSIFTRAEKKLKKPKKPKVIKDAKPVSLRLQKLRDDDDPEYAPPNMATPSDLLEQEPWI